jgi:hypothetical protein
MRDLGTSETQLQIARQSYNARLLSASLETIAEWHGKHKTGLGEQLAPGLSESEITQALAAIDCSPTKEMIALWSWHNGGVGTAPMVWYHDFLSVDAAVSEYRLLIVNPLAPWDPNYLPIFSFQGEWYGAYCGEPGLSASPVLHFFLEDEPRVTHRNLTTFLAGNAEALREGAVEWENEAMREDIQALFEIHQKFNPGYPFPYHVPANP